MEFTEKDYKLAQEYVSIQMANSDGEDDLAYYVAMVWKADPNMRDEDITRMSENK